MDSARHARTANAALLLKALAVIWLIVSALMRIECMVRYAWKESCTKNVQGVFQSESSMEWEHRREGCHISRHDEVGYCDH